MSDTADRMVTIPEKSEPPVFSLPVTDQLFTLPKADIGSPLHSRSNEQQNIDGTDCCKRTRESQARPQWLLRGLALAGCVCSLVQQRRQSVGLGLMLGQRATSPWSLGYLIDPRAASNPDGFHPRVQARDRRPPHLCLHPLAVGTHRNYLCLEQGSKDEMSSRPRMRQSPNPCSRAGPGLCGPSSPLWAISGRGSAHRATCRVMFRG